MNVVRRVQMSSTKAQIETSRKAHTEYMALYGVDSIPGVKGNGIDLSCLFMRRDHRATATPVQRGDSQRRTSFTRCCSSIRLYEDFW